MLLAFSLLLLLLPSTLSDPTPSRLRLILVRHGESQNNVLNEISKQNYIDNRYKTPLLLFQRHCCYSNAIAALPSPVLIRILGIPTLT